MVHGERGAQEDKEETRRKDDRRALATDAPPRPVEPPRQCPKHIDDPNPPPCGACRGARRGHEDWQRERRQWELAEFERARNAAKCQIHRGQPAHNCGPCRSNLLEPQWQAEQAEAHQRQFEREQAEREARSRRGRTLVAAALGRKTEDAA
jgi:hypothetical protein